MFTFNRSYILYSLNIYPTLIKMSLMTKVTTDLFSVNIFQITTDLHNYNVDTNKELLRDSLVYKDLAKDVRQLTSDLGSDK